MNRLHLPRGYKNPIWLEDQLKMQPSNYWINTGRRRALALFHGMSERVPAYKDFLKKNDVNPKLIRTTKEFSKLPSIDKDNYLRAYPREQLCWDGNFKDKSWVISTTSGSTGKPYYFPRDNSQDWQYAVSAELYLRNNFSIQSKSTLYIVGFPMGAWIGGLFTYEALKIVAESGRYNLSLITPGIHKREIIQSVKELGKNFDQIIIGSYAPFLKDILDDGEREGVNWNDYNLGFVFSAEAFSELFRDYVIKKTGLDNPYTTTLNHYGTVDLGTMAHETPISIMLRRSAIKDVDMYKALFSRDDKLPTFAQYNPALFYFEEEAGNLYCSAYSGIPLVRYDLKDSGGVLDFDEATIRLSSVGYQIDDALTEAGIGKTVWKLPYVYVYERNDFSVSFYAFQIYPEMIRRPLQAEELEDTVTGKFTMLVDFDESGRQKLEINIELKADREETQEIREHVQSLIVESLLTYSSEYRETHKMYGEEVHPQVVFWPYEDEQYFKPGVKQKWVKK